MKIAAAILFAFITLNAPAQHIGKNKGNTAKAQIDTFGNHLISKINYRGMARENNIQGQLRAVFIINNKR